MVTQGYMNIPQTQPQVQVQPQAKKQATTPMATYPQTNVQTVAPKPNSMSGVSINIISPSVYGNQGLGSVPYNPVYSYPQAPTPVNNINNNFSPINYAQSAPNNTGAGANSNASAKAEATTKKEEKPKKKKITPLTNEYIKTLENYLKNPNKEVRMTGAKQVLARFKEDDSRKNDAALTALMNIALQDPDNNVRAIAMMIPAAGYASGNDKTLALLQMIQQMKSNYNEDALLASQALMKIQENSNKVEIEVPQN